jgi:hypothetical protein
LRQARSLESVANEYGRQVMKMNKVHGPASGWVQRPPPNVAAEIIVPGHPTAAFGIPDQRGHAMLKTISAALLAASVLAAPAFAATSSHTAPVAKAATAKHRVLNADARMDHQVSHHRGHRHHHKVAALGKHRISKAAIKHTAAVKRG